ncbi:outer membrane beta-barrel protein [Pedobacter sp. SYP-B3415]|uniref:outer membrane beta-barrel protein n=1 Tax=Pedobacter sp. SYP-B3415 TaxID=2496641 RepID=UPI00101CFEFF|nr:outer membrane beta-barrel protein [Pedobacter sp. SYP-B3415]
MPKLTLSLLLLFASLFSYAQKAAIKGTVSDTVSKAPLELATVALVNAKDSSLISYTLSNKKGEFSLSGLPADRSMRLIISFAGYQSFKKNLLLNRGETLDMKVISLQGTNLADVVIRRGSPVVVKKDTIEFDAEAFKTRPNAVVEELLRKLPGVQVNVDGSILVNGKPISKLLIDGKEFFGNDPKVATKNLDADLIAKIQVYDDRDDDPEHKLSATEVNKIIDLKLKSKIRKSTLGKVYVGGGTRDRYEAGGILSTFRDTLQISLIGMGNNLNRTGFSTQELYSMGGFDRSGGDQVWNGTFGSSGGGGLENVIAGGANINNNYGKKLKMNLLYFYKHNERNFVGSGFREQTLSNTLLSNRYSNRSDLFENKHDLSGLIAWNPDTMRQLRYQPKINIGSTNSYNSGFNQSFNTQQPRLSDNNSRGQNAQDNGSFSHSFNFYRRLKRKGSSININHFLNFNANDSENFNYNDLVSYTADLQSEIFDRRNGGRRRNSSGVLGMSYNLRLWKKVTAEIYAGVNISTSANLAELFDRNRTTGNYDLFLANQSSDMRRTTFTEDLTPVLRFDLTKNYTLRVGANGNIQRVINKFYNTGLSVDRNHYNVFPSLSLNGPWFSVNYNESLSQPDISQMQPITIQYSQLYRFSGNPDLQPMHSRRLSANIYKYNYAKQINLNAYGSLTMQSNNVIQRNLIDATGATAATYVNKSGGINGYFGGNIGKQFKKSQNWQVGINTNLNGNIDRRAVFLNADEGIQNGYRFSIGQNMSFNYTSLLSINARYDFARQMTRYEQVNFAAVNTYQHTAGGDLSLRWPKKVIFDANYSFNYNPQVGQGFQRSAHMLNMAVSVLMLKKDRGQIKLSVYDLLDQNISVWRYASGNSVTLSENQVLRQYFLLNYQYKLNKYK